MEFLDPAAKKAHTIRLLVGYALLAVLVLLATMILVYQAQGYGYSSKKGVTQGGLLFIDSKPVSADVLLDGQKYEDKTSTRINLNEGDHSVTLKADKYREWNKKFSIAGGSVTYLQYPRLFPINISVGINKVLPQNPTWTSQSPDRRWLVYQQNTDPTVFTVADLLDPAKEQASLKIPAGILVVKNGSLGTISPVEWSDDNQHFLLQQKYADGSVSYAVIDREDATKSVNVSVKLKLTADQTLTLHDKKYDKYYVFSQAKGELYTAELKTGVISAPFVAGVVAFKSHGADIVTYITYVGAQPTEAKVVLLNGQKDSYNLKAIQRDPNNVYLIDQAKFDNIWYYVVGSPSNNVVRFYLNPTKRVKPNTTAVAPPQVSLVIANPQFISFSDNARFMAIQSANKFVVYDAEDQRIFRYTINLNIPITQQAKWMDGHRLTANSDGRVYVYDFDGTNVQNLVASKPEFSAYFDRDYKYLYTLVPQVDGKVGFQNAKMIAE